MDNRCNPGVPDEVVVAQGLPAGAGRGIFETAVYTCGHCQAQVYKNNKRTRPRGFCKKCSHVICDGCEHKYVSSGHVCKPWAAVVEEHLESVERAAQAAKSIIL